MPPSQSIKERRTITLANWRVPGAVPATVLMICWSAWYVSLQHERIHGHRTPWPWMKRLFGYGWRGPALAIGGTLFKAVRQLWRGDWR